MPVHMLGDEHDQCQWDHPGLWVNEERYALMREQRPERCVRSQGCQQCPTERLTRQCYKTVQNTGQRPQPGISVEMLGQLLQVCQERAKTRCLTTGELAQCRGRLGPECQERNQWQQDTRSPQRNSQYSDVSPFEKLRQPNS